MEPATLRFAGRHLIHGATPARVELHVFLCSFLKVSIVHVSIIPTDTYDCPLHVGRAAPHNASIAHPQGHFRLCHHKAGVNVLRHTAGASLGHQVERWVRSTPSSASLGSAELLCSMAVTVGTPRSTHTCSGNPNLKVLTVSEFNLC